MYDNILMHFFSKYESLLCGIFFDLVDLSVLQIHWSFLCQFIIAKYLIVLYCFYYYLFVTISMYKTGRWGTIRAWWTAWALASSAQNPLWPQCHEWPWSTTEGQQEGAVTNDVCQSQEQVPQTWGGRVHQTVARISS